MASRFAASPIRYTRRVPTRRAQPAPRSADATAVTACGTNIAPYAVLVRPYSLGLVKIPLAAGNVTSAMPWTTAAAFTTPASRAVAMPLDPSSGRAFDEVLTDPDGVRHRGQGRVHGSDAREEARVHDVEVVDLVGLAVLVEHRRRRIAPEAARPRLVRDTRDRDAHVHVEVLVEHVVLGEPDVVHDVLQLVVQPVGLVVVGRVVREMDVAVAVEGDAVIGHREVLGSQPEVLCVLGDVG